MFAPYLVLIVAGALQYVIFVSYLSAYGDGGTLTLYLLCACYIIFLAAPVSLFWRRVGGVCAVLGGGSWLAVGIATGRDTNLLDIAVLLTAPLVSLCTGVRLVLRSRSSWLRDRRPSGIVLATLTGLPAVLAISIAATTIYRLR